MKKNIFLGIAVLFIILAVILVKGVRIQSVDEYYLEHLQDVKEDSETVTLSIRCDSLLKNYGRLDPALQSAEFVPEDGVILNTAEYVLREGDTVFDLLSRVARYYGIQMEYKSTGGTVYIEGIHYLYEFSCGPLSGWMYRVNGEFPGVGCSEYRLRHGDQVEWVYSCDLGKDVGDIRTEEK